MRGVWRQVKKEKPSFLPNRSQFFHLMITMNRCIIQHHKGVLTHLKGKRIKKFDNFVRSNTIGRCKTLVIIFAVNHTKYIHSCTSLGGFERHIACSFPCRLLPYFFGFAHRSACLVRLLSAPLVRLSNP